MIHFNSRAFVIGLGLAGALVAPGIFAQQYPVKPITIIVGYGAGSGADIPARLVGKMLADDFKQAVVIDNRAGAAGTIATAKVAASPPDGYTLLLLTSSDTIVPALRAAVPYDLVRDFTPISLVASSPFVLVVGHGSAIKNVDGIISAANSKPGKVSFASAGVGGASHLVGEIFASTAGIKVLHVPFKSGSDSAVATGSGEVDFSFVSVASALPLIQSGILRPIAVTSMRRSSLLPQVPTLNESGMPGYDQSVWYGVLAPAGLPKPLTAQLNQAIAKMLDNPDFRARLKSHGLEPGSSTPEDFSRIIRQDLTRNAMLVRQANIKVQ